MHISLCSGLIFRRNCRKSEGQESARRSLIVYLRDIAHKCVCVCVCVCVHVHVHASTCALISDTSIVQVFVIVMRGMDVHTHFTLVFTLISPSTHVHPLQVRRPTDEVHLPLKLAQNNM